MKDFIILFCTVQLLVGVVLVGTGLMVAVTGHFHLAEAIEMVIIFEIAIAMFAAVFFIFYILDRYFW